jgi:hypothetical protein
MKQPLYSFYDRSAPIYTQPRYLPPSKVLDADVTDSVIGEGCVIKVRSFFFNMYYFLLFSRFSYHNALKDHLS